MKKSIFRISLLTLLAAFFIYACAPAAETAPVAPTSIAGEYLSIEYTDAASLRNQLAFGTIKLEGTANAVTPEQAKTLIPFWQAIISLSGDETTATEELTAVQDQIVAVLTAEQLQAIAAMKLTNADLSTFYAEYGIVLPTPVPGVTKVPGSGSGKTEEEKAAAQATAAALGQTTGTGQSAKTLLFEKTIEYLTG
ncbi:MAG: hypothetical protein Q7T89_04345, partial [Anaerolineales bacterium]|nr:hypothetical protein [Anaerolineales bacterium]